MQSSGSSRCNTILVSQSVNIKVTYMSEPVSEQVSQSVCQKSKFKFKTVKAVVDESNLLN